MIDEDTPHQACSIGGCPSITEFCSYSMSCPSATEHGDGVIVVGTIAAGLAQQVHRADGRILSETIAPNETAVLIPSSLLSELPEVKRLREENEKLIGAVRIMHNLSAEIMIAHEAIMAVWKDKASPEIISQIEGLRYDLFAASDRVRPFFSEGKSSSPQAEEKA